MGDMRTVYAWAARQHGVVSRRQLAKAGFDRARIHRRVESGAWLRLDHGVVALASSPPTWKRQLMAAVLSRSRAVVGHTSAGHLFDLKGCRPGRPVIVVPKGSNARSAIARVVESDQFDRLATTRIDGFEVTTVPETLLSLAAEFDRLALEATFDDALLTGRLDLDAMKDILDREAGRRPRGIKGLREMTALRLPTAPSQHATYLEALLERLLGSLDLPAWTREHPFSLRGKPSRVDVYVPDCALVIEADGRNWHLRRADFEVDRRRDNDLATRGIQVLRYTYRMLTTEPDRCRDEVLAVARVRAARRSA